MSIGIKLGRGVGALGALAVHGATRGVEGLGQFGSDLVTGAEEGYAEKAAYLDLSDEQRQALQEQKRALRAARNAPIAAAVTAKRTAKT